MNWKTASLIALLVLVACVWWLGLNKSIFGTSATVIAIQVLAISLIVWARFTFGIRSFHATANPTTGGLVRSGPYKYIRHPIYAAVLYFIWAGIIAHASEASVGAGLVASAMTAGYKIVFRGRADALSVRPTRTNGHRDVELVFMSEAGRYVDTVEFHYVNANYRISARRTEKANP
jgi:hypothetical protein